MSRRVIVTGGAGFIGRSVTRQLATQGDHVVALVRDPSTVSEPDLARVELVRSDLSEQDALAAQMTGADGVIHVAGSYLVGIPKDEQPRMFDANVGATERVLDAAIAAGVPRIVTVSSVSVFGNTRSRVVDETFVRDATDGFMSTYDETKWLAHQAAVMRIRAGAPIVIAQPGTVYGPRDHSGIGLQLEAAYLGTAPFIGLGGVGISPCHVDDVASGIIAALDRGRPGEAYVLAGQNMRMADGMRLAARVGGRRPPRVTIPDTVLRVGAMLGPNLGGLFGIPPNLGEIVRTSIGVTYWASSEKAARELGYRTRDLASGFADAFSPAGR